MKIVACMPVYNEEWILDLSLAALRPFVDEILVLDDGSTDRSADIARQAGCVVLESGRGIADGGSRRCDADGVAAMRRRLLNEARSRGATHTVWLDADEVLTQDGAAGFRQTLAAMHPGQKLFLPWLAMWKSPHFYRDDDSVWADNRKDFVFCEDGVSDYLGASMHEARTPGDNDPARQIHIDSGLAVMHYQFADFDRFSWKQVWYRCLERVHAPGKSAEEINATYAICDDVPNVKLTPVNPSWIGPLDLDLRRFRSHDSWYRRQVEDLFAAFGTERFSGLDLSSVRVPRTCLVLGSAGLIGSHLCAHLEASGHRVLRADIRTGTDLRQESDSHRQLFEQADFVFFLASDIGGAKYICRYQDSFSFIQNNVTILKNCFGWLRETGTPFVFATSTMSNMDGSLYGTIKKVGEGYSKALGGLSVRFWNVYGYEDSPAERLHVVPDLIRKALHEPKIELLSDGSERRQFLHVDDCSRALALIMERYHGLQARQVVDVTSGEWTQIAEVAAMIGELSGKRVVAGAASSTHQDRDNEPDDFFHELWQPQVCLRDGVAQIFERMAHEAVTSQPVFST